MRIGLVSDSHGELENLKDAAWKLAYNWHVRLIAHLGDECEDVDAIRDMRLEIIEVPGVYSKEYQDPTIPNRLIREIEGKKILFTHTAQTHKNDLPGDLNPEQLALDGKVDVIAYGHTHIPKAKFENGVLWVNPGHLKNEDKKGYAPSFAVLDIDKDNARVLLIDLKSGDIFDSCDMEGD
ncbi:MAG: YfcE family phosphodiesterase [Thermacetogeniaceae bacterium]|jgi:putative phosphoesterase|nr:YfcE family phosphodiesterase [Syntrophomonadaceae bacterium]